MDFYLDEEHVLSSGPVSPVVPGDKIDWDIHSKQGVFFFPNPQLCQKGISSVECQATLKPKEGEFAFDFRLN